MIVTRKEKVVASLIVILFLASWLVLAWITKSGGFKIFGDVIKNPDVLTK